VTVDAHIHLWRLARGDNLALLPDMTPIYRDLGPQDVKPRLDAAGVDRIVVVQAAETLAEALFITGLARKFPWITGIVAWIDPSSPSVEEEAAALAWLPVVKGVRPVRDDNRNISWMLDRRLERGWRALATNGLSLDILVQDWREIPLATALAQGNPELTIILDHCGKPDIAGGLFDPWASCIEEMAGLPNVNCKLSGLINCAKPGATLADVDPYAAHVLSAFGPSRVMWASDWPPLDLATDYGRWMAMSCELLRHLPSDRRDQVMSGTATRVYRLNQQQ
jgi:L-fuconolactonase